MHKFLPHPVVKSVYRFYEDLATPVSLSMKMLADAGEWDQIAMKRVIPEHYLCAEDYWRDASAVELLRKLEELPTSFDRKKVAEEGFLKCEGQCFRSNLRLLPYLSPGLPDTETGVCDFLSRARKIARRILGPCPDDVDGRFGPGATFGDRGRLTTVPDKMSSEPTLTFGAWPFYFQWRGTAWHRASLSSKRYPSYVRGNRFTTVPKDCTKHRGIAVEPSLNLFYQLGYGRSIRRRLGLFGIILEEGQDIHRRVACEASIKGHLATLDLSNASDTICYNLVKLLLPHDWFDVLNDLRSPRTLFRDRWFLLEKFSSMGNGFTFELETLIFLCLILALDPTGQKLVPGQNVFVFGDDIIVPSDFSNAVISCLRFFGLDTNERKSFSSGPFRESCGGDYFLGVNVRPHYLKESPNEPQHLISLANGLRRSARNIKDRTLAIRRAWFGVLDALPGNIRSLRGPEALGDLCIHDDERNFQFRERSGIRYLRVYRPARYREVSWRNFRPEVVLASAVYGVENGWSQVGSQYRQRYAILPRDAVLGYKIGWVAWS